MTLRLGKRVLTPFSHAGPYAIESSYQPESPVGLYYMLGLDVEDFRKSTAEPRLRNDHVKSKVKVQMHSESLQY